MNIIKRNLPVFIIGGVTLAIFLGIIIAGQKNTGTNSPTLTEADQQDLIAEHTYTLGNQESVVNLVEFSDYECPACKFFQPVVRGLYRQYPGQISVAYRHFPLPQHPQARNAAVAAQAAGAQGKFWEYSDVLFENNTNLQRENLIKYAEELGLDIEKFTQDLDNETFKQQVNIDLSTANKLRLNSTPSFFLNGKLMQFTDVQDFQDQIIAALGTQEQPESSPSGSDNPAQEQAEEVSVIYGENGFYPQATTGYVGKLLVIKNETSQAITLEKPGIKSDLAKATVTVPAGSDYKVNLDKEGTWEYKVKESGRFGAVTVYPKS